KQFLRGVGCYGAEAKIEGFSGYLCELLIIKYKTFYSLLIEAKSWRYMTRIVIDKDSDAMFDNPLIVVDPVDPRRNVASALSKDKFDLFIVASREYIRKPSLRFFYPESVRPWSIDKIKKELKRRSGVFLGVELDKPDILDENLYPQLRKAIRVLKETCERYGFSIIDIGFTVLDDKKKIYIIINTAQDSLPPFEVHMGPPVYLKNNVDDFMGKWMDDPRVVKKPYIKDGRVYVEKRREYDNIYKMLEKGLKGLSLGKDITNMLKKGYRVIKEEDVITSDLRGYWTIYLDGRYPWEREGDEKLAG
ncbi:MAG: hypothetical protein QXS02_06330, partial [Candidatus Thermoplasmatota archaeon]